MKKIVLLLVFIIVLSLSACDIFAPKELDYSDFPDHLISSYGEAEDFYENKYVVYYYSKNCSHCASIKQELLEFFSNFDTLPFYILNISDARDLSGLEEFVGTPSLLVMSDDVVSEAYIGSDKVESFISEYKNINLDYDSFSDVQLTTYQSILDIENDTYILYYYLDNCPHCMLVKDDVLAWAFTKSVGDIYFMNGANVVDPDNVPTELIILNSGTPIILIMSNGVFTDEYYSGSEEILEYILAIGEGKITNIE